MVTPPNLFCIFCHCTISPYLIFPVYVTIPLEDIAVVNTSSVFEAARYGGRPFFVNLAEKGIKHSSSWERN